MSDMKMAVDVDHPKGFGIDICMYSTASNQGMGTGSDFSTSELNRVGARLCPSRVARQGSFGMMGCR
ncbi:Hypothetical protein SMAX5B_008385 [Scophthalmus maximus]|uniref:Uncharacterized protein n=1 Tax=Scophthalmus maximus TaxID=52904 RepID=A0A2U9B3Z8_SCOMX|nr:Hypothetical protein SMAX5B_008385 [Scophthalmus maximus]